MHSKNTSPIISSLIAGSLALLFVADRWWLPALSLELFYLLPIALAALMGVRRGLLSVLVATLLVKVIPSKEDEWWRLTLLGTYWELFTLVGFYSVIAMLIAGVKSLNREADLLATTDPQTRLLNQSAFLKHLTTEKNRAMRLGHSFSIVYFDLDNFKAINDLHGHTFGNIIIETISNRLQTDLREYDLAARMGGDEFAILLPETNTDNAQQIVKRLQNNIATLSQIEMKSETPVTLSAGIVTCTTCHQSAKELIDAADKLMYQAKQQGGNFICADEYPAIASTKKVSP